MTWSKPWQKVSSLRKPDSTLPFTTRLGFSIFRATAAKAKIFALSGWTSRSMETHRSRKSERLMLAAVFIPKLRPSSPIAATPLDARAADTAHPGASSREHHDSQDIRHGVSQTGYGGAIVRIGGREGRGLPVGSGVVESACKHIVGNRFKGAGCRGSKVGGNALLAVKCCLENVRWPDFLDWRVCRVAAD